MHAGNHERFSKFRSPQSERREEGERRGMGKNEIRERERKERGDIVKNKNKKKDHKKKKEKENA